MKANLAARAKAGLTTAEAADNLRASLRAYYVAGSVFLGEIEACTRIRVTDATTHAAEDWDQRVTQPS